MMFGGNVGVYTGMKPHAFSISENERTVAKYGNSTVGKIWSFASNMNMAFMGYNEISWIIRESFEKCDDWNCAYEMLSGTPIVADGYITIAGVKTEENAIIARDHWGSAHTYHMTGDQWYLVQTNSDHWKGICPIRCQTAKAALDSVGRNNIDLNSLRHKVLYKEPVENDTTIYNSLMCPATGTVDDVVIMKN